MKAALIIGLILIVLGIVSLVAGGITYASQEEVIDIGPIEASAQTEEKIPIPPFVGGLSLAAGIFLVAMSARKG